MSIITTRHLINSAFPKKELNIVTFYREGILERELVKFGHRIHFVKKNNNNLINIPGLYPLSLTNFYALYDVILCTECLNNYDDAVSLSRQLHIPVLFYEQQKAPLGMSPDKLFLNKQKYVGQNIVFSNKEIAATWRFPERECFIADYNVIPTKLFKTKTKNKIWNNYSNQNDKNILEVFLNQIPNLEQVTINDDLTEVFDDTKFYISLVASEETPLDMLYAMSKGCVVLTNKSKASESLVKHGENGFILKDVVEFNTIMQSLPQHEIDFVSKNAIKTIENRKNTFDNLNLALIETSKRVFVK